MALLATGRVLFSSAIDASHRYYDTNDYDGQA